MTGETDKYDFDAKIALSNAAADSSRSSSVFSSAVRPRIHGKFIFVGEEKLYLRGVTYGTFAPADEDLSEYDAVKVERDFSLMAANGINTVRVYTVPPRWLLKLEVLF